MFIIKGEKKEKVRERLDYIVDHIEKQGHYDFQVCVRETAEGCVGALKLHFHKKAYPSDYKKPDILLALPGLSGQEEKHS